MGPNEALDRTLKRETSGPLRIAHLLPQDGEVVRTLRKEGTDVGYATSLRSYEPWTDADFREALARVRSIAEPQTRLFALLDAGGRIPVSLPDPVVIEPVLDELVATARTHDARQSFAVGTGGYIESSTSVARHRAARDRGRAPRTRA